MKTYIENLGKEFVTLALLVLAIGALYRMKNDMEALGFFEPPSPLKTTETSLLPADTDTKKNPVSAALLNERVKIFSYFVNGSRETPSYDDALSFIEKETRVKLKGTPYEHLFFSYPPSLSSYVVAPVTFIPHPNGGQGNIFLHYNLPFMKAYARAVLVRVTRANRKNTSPTPEKAAQSITTFIARSVQYDYDYTSNGYFLENSYHNILFGLTQKTGICIDKARYAQEFARAIGIPSRIVIVGDYGLSNHAIPSFYVGGKWLVTDPTSQKKKFWKPMTLSRYEKETKNNYIGEEAGTL